MTKLKAAAPVRRDVAHRSVRANNPGGVAQAPETFFGARKRME
jgi:hypothetical protein